MHVVGVSVWEGAKCGLSKKVSKRNVFTPRTLSVIHLSVTWRGFWRVWRRWLETFIKKQNENICSCNKVLTLLYYGFMIDNRNGGTDIMRKSISISIRVSEDELEKFKEAARLEAYASYSEFVRRTALIEATRIIKENNEGENTYEHN